MSVNVDTAITPSLHPENVKHINGYDDDTRVFLAPTEVAFTVAYTGIQEVLNAKALAARNGAWTDDAKIIYVDNYATKQMARITGEFDRVLANLDKSIASIERDLTAPVESRAGVAVASEVRAYCKALGTAERIGFIQQAINEADETTVTALLGAPAYLSGLTNDLQKSYVKLYREKNAPDMAKRLRAMTGAKEMIETRAGLVFTALEKAVGAPPHKARRLREANTAAEKALIMSER